MSHRRLGSGDQRPHCLVILAKDGHHFLWLRPLAEAREAAQVAEDDGHLAPVASQDRFVAGGNKSIGDLGREEAAQPAHALQFVKLLLHAAFERPVQLRRSSDGS